MLPLPWLAVLLYFLTAHDTPLVPPAPRPPFCHARAALILLPQCRTHARCLGFARDWGGRGHACWGCRATSEEEKIAIDKTAIDKGGLGLAAADAAPGASVFAVRLTPRMHYDGPGTDLHYRAALICHRHWVPAGARAAPASAPPVLRESAFRPPSRARRGPLSLPSSRHRAAYAVGGREISGEGEGAACDKARPPPPLSAPIDF